MCCLLCSRHSRFPQALYVVHVMESATRSNGSRVPTCLSACLSFERHLDTLSYVGAQCKSLESPDEKQVEADVMIVY